MSKLARWPGDIVRLLAEGIIRILGSQAEANSTPSPAALTPALLIAPHPFVPPRVDLEAVSGHAVVFLPLCMDGGAARVGLPRGDPPLCYGKRVGPENRDSCARPAQGWADALFAPRTDVFVYYQLTLWEDTDSSCLVTAACISHPPPEGLAQAAADSPEALSMASGPELVWASLGALQGRLYVAVGAAVESLVACGA